MIRALAKNRPTALLDGVYHALMRHAMSPTMNRTAIRIIEARDRLRIEEDRYVGQDEPPAIVEARDNLQARWDTEIARQGFTAAAWLMPTLADVHEWRQLGGPTNRVT